MMTFDPLAGDRLRAETWDDFVGQQPLKDRLQLHLTAAIRDGQVPGHILLAAEPGFGKTTLTRIIARKLGVPFEVMTMPVTTADLATLLVIREFDGVLLLDELHRSSVKQQEELMPLIESHYIQYHGEKFMAGWLMIVGATTDRRKVIAPLKDRFDWIPTIDPYTEEDLAEIIQGMSTKLHVTLDDEALQTLAGAAGGTPRNARRFALAARKLYVVYGKVPDAEAILDYLRIDENGLTVDHRRYLAALHKLGIQAGIKRLSTYLHESEQVVEDIERLLIDEGYIEYTHEGRGLLTRGFELLREGKDTFVVPTIE